jgi:hypothetical protein
VVRISCRRASQIFNTSVDRSEGRIYDRIDSPGQIDSPRQSGKHLVLGAPQRAPVSALIS